MAGQSIAITAQSLRTIPQRWGPALVAVVGVAGVVGVFIAVLSIAEGFERTLLSTGSEDNAIVLRGGSTSELDSGLSSDQITVMTESDAVRRAADGQPLVSPELYVIISLPKLSTGTDANVPFRGVGPMASQLRRSFVLVDGRMFEPGKNEVIVGVGAASQFSDLNVGDTIVLGNSRWDVVGQFTTGGGVAESEVWTDVRTLQSAYRRGNAINSAFIGLQSAERFEDFKSTLEADPRITANVMTEQQYYAEQSQALSTFIRVIGYTIAVLMALGATFGALNTMYSTVAERAREISTLRSLGFSRVPITVSVLTEALLLALVGGLLGGLFAYLVFNGFTVSTLNFSGFSQIVFAFAVTPELIMRGLFLATFIGLIGGLAPAIAAARRPIVEGLRTL